MDLIECAAVGSSAIYLCLCLYWYSYSRLSTAVEHIS